MTATGLLERLARHRTLRSAPRRELQWLVDHGRLQHFAAGAPVTVQGQPLADLFILLSGHVTTYMDRGTGRHKVAEYGGGDVTGALPYSRMSGAHGTAFTDEPTDVLAIARADFSGLIRECHEVTSLLVDVMLDRTRNFRSSDLQDERMISLGKMSALLAHELNNPVAAIERNAAMLDDWLAEVERTARALGAARLTEAQHAAVDAMHASCAAASAPSVLSPLAQAEREEQMAAWLAARGVDDEVAVPLAETNVTFEALDRLAAAVDQTVLDIVVRWAAARCFVRQLASDLCDAATRIAGLVSAVKGFTHMDQAMVAEPVDLRTSIGNTVTVFTAKAREKSAAITVTLAEDLPKARGFAGELNQIWSNLIDNALDAIARGGRVDVTATREPHGVVVRVIDNGPGIPPDVRARMFDPFFTTKPVGQGTGLGLDIVRRLLPHNEADLEVESVPGRTEFRVTLPVAEEPPERTGD